tara:strand:+ start:5095 stop:5760 length:666 start_codon:yes stop_codon:yes gene_type:complete
MKQYKTFIFDCDGVILNSNTVKSEAFYQAALPYGKTAAEELVQYHKKYGGVSRYRKFSYFMEHIKPQNIIGPNIDSLLSCYADKVKEGLRSCQIAPKLKELREKYKQTKWLVASGGDQQELRDIFSHREISQLFDGGIFGSPDTKEEILEREKRNGNIIFPALFLGDSAYDHTASTGAGMEFVFVSDWTEVENWRHWCHINNIASAANLEQFLETEKAPNV